MNPYEVLGVAKDATAADVKAAYRLAASRAHPDREGGSTERMTEVNEANAVLSDPERRRRFDETGETSAGPTLEQEATQLLSSVLGGALDQDALGVIEFARKSVAELRRKLTTGRHGALSKADKLEAKRKRVRHKGTGPNLVHALIDTQVASLRKQAADMERGLAIAEKVAQLLDAYDEDMPPPELLTTYELVMGRRSRPSFDQFAP